MHIIIYICKLQILFWEKTRIVRHIRHVYIIHVRTQIKQTTKRKIKCQNLKAKHAVVKIVLACTWARIVRKIKSQIVTNKLAARLGGFCLSFLGFCVIITGEFKKLDSGLSQAYFIRCGSIVKLMLSVLFCIVHIPDTCGWGAVGYKKRETGKPQNQ